MNETLILCITVLSVVCAVFGIRLSGSFLQSALRGRGNYEQYCVWTIVFILVSWFVNAVLIFLLFEHVSSEPKTQIVYLTNLIGFDAKYIGLIYVLAIGIFIVAGCVGLSTMPPLNGGFVSDDGTLSVEEVQK